MQVFENLTPLEMLYYAALAAVDGCLLQLALKPKKGSLTQN